MAPTLFEKINTLISANLHGIVDRALETNSVQVMDEYIRQVERNLEALEDSAATVGGTVKTLKRKYEGPQGQINCVLVHDDCIRVEYNASCFLLRDFFQRQDHFKRTSFINSRLYRNGTS